MHSTCLTFQVSFGQDLILWAISFITRLVKIFISTQMVFPLPALENGVLLQSNPHKTYRQLILSASILHLLDRTFGPVRLHIQHYSFFHL